MKPFTDPSVERVFAAYPPTMRCKLLALRALIFRTAAETPGVGDLEETLKWGEPAYVTARSGSGSTIRIDRRKQQPNEYAMYFHCQTTLVEQFRTLFPNDFRFEGNRALVFGESDAVPVDALALCIATALTYHRNRRSAPPRHHRSRAGPPMA